MATRRNCKPLRADAAANGTANIGLKGVITRSSPTIEKGPTVRRHRVRPLACNETFDGWGREQGSAMTFRPMKRIAPAHRAPRSMRVDASCAEERISRTAAVPWVRKRLSWGAVRLVPSLMTIVEIAKPDLIGGRYVGRE